MISPPPFTGAILVFLDPGPDLNLLKFRKKQIKSDLIGVENREGEENERETEAEKVEMFVFLPFKLSRHFNHLCRSGQRKGISNKQYNKNADTNYSIF
jgi:hypothetical protein